MRYSHTFAIAKDDFSAAGEASATIKRQLKQLGISAPLIRKIAIASYEAEINLIIHSLGGTLTVEIDDGTITIVSRDQGPGIPDINLAMTEGYSTATQSVRQMGFGAGMGLPNINRNSDHMEIASSPDGTTITMCFRID